MKFNALYSFAIISISCHTSLALPLQRRATPTIKVLASPAPADGTTPAPGQDNLCSEAQVTAIKAGMVEANVLAAAASAKLSGKADAEKSEGVTTWIGACM